MLFISRLAPLDFQRNNPFGGLASHGPLWSVAQLSSTGWQVLAACPLSLCGERSFLSFGRYDHQTGRSEPLLSSTSPHQEPNFHRRHEWNAFSLLA